MKWLYGEPFPPLETTQGGAGGVEAGGGPHGEEERRGCARRSWAGLAGRSAFTRPRRCAGAEGAHSVSVANPSRQLLGSCVLFGTLHRLPAVEDQGHGGQRGQGFGHLRGVAACQESQGGHGQEY